MSSMVCTHIVQIGVFHLIVRDTKSVLLPEMIPSNTIAIEESHAAMQKQLQRSSTRNKDNSQSSFVSKQ